MIGNNIKKARKRIGFTQEELAFQIGVTAQAVSRWESGTGLPDITMIVPLAQVESFEHGVEAMKVTVRKNLQNFTRAINKEILYATEDMSWHDDPQKAVAFGEWGIRLIHAFSENEDMISYCRGFTRDLYQYIMNADMRLEDYEAGAAHYHQLEAEMERHYNHYQKVLADASQREKYEERVMRNMVSYTSEFIAQKKERLLGFLRHTYGDEKFEKLREAIER